MKHAAYVALAAAALLAAACNLIIGLSSEPALEDAAPGEAGSESAVGDGGGDSGAGDSAGGDASGAVQISSTRVRHIALDDASVYFADTLNFVVGKMGKDGSGVTPLATGQLKTQFYPDYIAIDDTSVYWTSFNGLHSCGKAGCGGTPTDIIDDNADGGPYYSPLWFGVDTTTAYFADVIDSTHWAIRKVPKGASNGLVSTIVPAAKLCPTVNWVDVYQPYMYFTCDDGRVGRANLSTGVVEILSGASPPANPFELTTDGVSIYFGELTLGANIYQMPVHPDAGVTPVALSQPYPTTMYLDSTHLFWANAGPMLSDGEATIIDCDITAGCAGTLKTFVAGQDTITDIESDGTRIFWAAWGGGTSSNDGIWSLAYPP